MNIKLATCLLAVALLVGWLFYLVAGGRDGEVRGSGAVVTPSDSSELVSDPSMEATAPLPVSAPSAVAREAARPVVEAAAPVSWRGELAGLTGRVVEKDGAPVPGMRVALIEIDSIFLFDGSSIDAEEPRIELEETVTDGDGRFLLGGARGPAFHGLGVDLGGPRATVRVIDHALPHRERTDIGDVVLAPYGVVTGRVVDEGGAPVAGARVRFAPLPAEILQASPQDIRSDSLIAVGQMVMGGEEQGVIELPEWVRKEIDRLPVPTTQSADDGTFRLVGVALAQVVGGVDKRGYVGVPLGPIDVTDGEEDVGAVVLERGRTIRGVVEDAFGEPAVGLEVHAGAELFPGVVSILQACGPTDDEGRFELTGVPETGQVVAVTRRARHEPWSTTITARHDRVLLEIEALVHLTVNVRDGAGEPVTGAAIRLTPGRRSGKRSEVSQVFMLLPKAVGPAVAFREVEPGRYVNESVGAGFYEIQARAPGLAPGYQQADCQGSENEVTVVCPTGRRVELLVRDAGTKAPVVAARGSVLRASPSGFSKVAVQSTDQDGRALFGPLPDFAGEEQINGFFPAEAMLLVQHPRYGDHSAKLEQNATSVVVELESGGTLAGRVHWGGAVPTRVYMLVLEYHGADGMMEMFHMPRFTVTGLEGEFRLANLVPGKYSVELSERFLDRDPLGMMNDEFDVATLHREEIEIRNGETTELVIDLTPTGRGTTARVVGRVRVEGRNLEGAEVAVRGNESVRVVTDERGRFATDPFSVRGSAHVTIEGDVRLADGATRRMQLYEESVELQQDDVHEIDVDIYPMTLRVRILDGTSGEPVADAEVSARIKNQEESGGFQDENGTTGSTGEATLLILGPGEYTVTASAPGFGRTASDVSVPEGGMSAPAPVRLRRSVPCAGRVQVDSPEAVGQGQGFAYLQVQGEDNAASAGTMLKAPDYLFTLEGLTEGKYRTHIYMSGRRGEEGTLELGPEGNQDLVISFVESDDDDED